MIVIGGERGGGDAGCRLAGSQAQGSGSGSDEKGGRSVLVDVSGGGGGGRGGSGGGSEGVKVGRKTETYRTVLKGRASEEKWVSRL